MRLQMRRADHQLIRLAALGRQCRKDLVEHPQPTPSDEAVVDRLMRATVRRRRKSRHGCSSIPSVTTFTERSYFDNWGTRDIGPMLARGAVWARGVLRSGDEADLERRSVRRTRQRRLRAACGDHVKFRAGLQSRGAPRPCSSSRRDPLSHGCDAKRHNVANLYQKA